jgi:hypothetical protein
LVFLFGAAFKFLVVPFVVCGASGEGFVEVGIFFFAGFAPRGVAVGGFLVFVELRGRFHASALGALAVGGVGVLAGDVSVACCEVVFVVGLPACFFSA